MIELDQRNNLRSLSKFSSTNKFSRSERVALSNDQLPEIIIILLGQNIVSTIKYPTRDLDERSDNKQKIRRHDLIGPLCCWDYQ